MGPGFEHYLPAIRAAANKAVEDFRPKPVQTELDMIYKGRDLEMVGE